MDPLLQLAEALESGKYKQNFHQLYNKDENSFCIWGVASDIFFKGDKKKILSRGNGLPRQEVQDWLFSQSDIKYPKNLSRYGCNKNVIEEDKSLRVLNDKYKISFSMFAKFIRENLVNKVNKGHYKIKRSLSQAELKALDQ